MTRRRTVSASTILPRRRCRGGRQREALQNRPVDDSKEEGISAGRSGPRGASRGWRSRHGEEAVQHGAHGFVALAGQRDRHPPMIIGVVGTAEQPGRLEAIDPAQRARRRLAGDENELLHADDSVLLPRDEQLEHHVPCGIAEDVAREKFRRLRAHVLQLACEVGQGSVPDVYAIRHYTTRIYEGMTLCI